MLARSRSHAPPREVYGCRQAGYDGYGQERHKRCMSGENLMERRLREKLSGGAFQDVEPRHARTMKSVRGKGNRTTEAPFRAALVGAGIAGWHLNVRQLAGTPDLYFPKERLAVFIDGCFWHGCRRCGHVPNKNRRFWQAKIDRNRERDRRNTAKLRNQGVSVLRFWEHDVADSPKACVDRTLRRLAVRRHQSLRKQETAQ